MISFSNSDTQTCQSRYFLAQIRADSPRPEEEVAEDLTMHEKMYRIATAKYNPFSIGGSESIHDFE